MCETTLLNQISLEYQKILGRRLVGIYVHGSLAFGCYRRERSDIDFLTVTRDPPAPAEKEALIDALLKLENDWPAKGIEMSVVLKKYCVNFVYPTPFELHFSKMYTERCRQDRKTFCRAMHGTDRDLAAHFTVSRAVGITLCGESAASVFGAVPPRILSGQHSRRPPGIGRRSRGRHCVLPAESLQGARSPGERPDSFKRAGRQVGRRSASAALYLLD